MWLHSCIYIQKFILLESLEYNYSVYFYKGGVGWGGIRVHYSAHLSLPYFFLSGAEFELKTVKVEFCYTSAAYLL